MAEIIGMLQNAQDTYGNVLVAILRYLVPVLAGFLLFRCIKPLLSFQKDPEIWGWAVLSNGAEVPITHWETVIGSSRRSDIRIDSPGVSRNHAVLTRYDDGSWTISNADPKNSILVNNLPVEVRAIQPEDIITIGEMEMTLQPITKRQERHLAQLRTKASTVLYSVSNLVLLTVFQALCLLAFLLGEPMESAQTVFLGFAGIALCQWALLAFYVCIRRTSFEIETIAFFLCTMGMCAIATVVPHEALKQLIAMVLGLVAFLAVGWSLRNLERAKLTRRVASVAGIGFLVITLLFGTTYYGAKNWLIIGSFSIQPSELSKICFVYAGASAMDRLMDKKNLIGFIIYSALMCVCLALMNDFGTALIFFCTFLVIAYLRSGSVGTIGLACASVGFAGVLVLKIAPHALRRFAAWRHIWEMPFDAGYQQTRALMCMASGGLLGLGAGRGWMKNLFAADSDVVIATLSEEWGILIVIMMLLCFMALAVFAVRSSKLGRSSFYVIGACTASAVLLVQVILNALGTVDILPLTGVTFPFVSNGGSSMICAWGLLAFVKAGDTRQNASFAVKLAKKRGLPDE